MTGQESKPWALALNLIFIEKSESPFIPSPIEPFEDMLLKGRTTTF